MAILRIKDEYGNVHEVLALRGEKGDPGYVLTEADKEEIAQIVFRLGGSSGSGSSGSGSSSLKNIIVTIDENRKASHTSQYIYDFVQNGGNVILRIYNEYTALSYVSQYCACFAYIGDDSLIYLYMIDQYGNFDEQEISLVSYVSVESMIENSKAEMVQAVLEALPAAEEVGF
jgi:hypothetical protein